MGRRIGMEVAIAAAEAVALCRIDVAAVYPITPQSHIAEHLSDIVHDGRIDAEFLTVESEHSSISACAGASAAGARVYTATSSQGLMLMHEILPIVSAMRLPVVMGVANRAVSGPLNIWNDHTDIMPQRDCGWIQLFAENGQEVIDMSIQSFKIAEHPEVMLPVLVNIDGFQLTHMIEPMEMPTQEEVDRFLPERKPFATLHPDNPLSMGCFNMPDIYMETMKAKDVALINAKKTIIKIWNEWAKLFGREYRPVESYKAKDAEVLIVTMGSMGETASVAVDEMRKAGKKVGLIKIKLWRPFPVEEFKAAVRGCKTIAVMDRALSFGGAGGPVATELKSLFYHDKDRPRIADFIMGLGGRDVRVEDFITMAERASEKEDDTYEFLGVRE
ncbi:MAG TPA: transketolase C-terminal domain-containing protein [Syntrophales bacterium]|nr:transketolase C-terminal domain-containing protein [Syntrophales bacterium]HOL59788.1 transketolase C-terminal domain-containing protein [Syntrophales bacterium]HPO35902.1 transketolase C-terminal domain-containing protein [Syntrophales bacterium]